MGEEEKVHEEIKTLMSAAESMEKDGKLNDDEREALSKLCVKNGIDLPSFDETSEELKKKVMPRIYNEEIKNAYAEPPEEDETAHAVGAPRAPNPEWRRRAAELYDYYDKIFNLNEKYAHQQSYVWHSCQHLALEEYGLLREGTESWMDLTKKSLEEGQSRKRKA
jgi:hypothetical protein